MKGMFIIKDKETGEIIQEIHPWALFVLLTYHGEFELSCDEIDIFIDEILIPMPEGMNLKWKV
ncbi:MAG TPA: hypothetical protein ENI07_14840 [Desulfobacterales bacterium]|nr:hypothetical protein [Desulfobacterales bacterium]